MTVVAHSPLGKKSTYSDQYDPGLLFPIPRTLKRAEIGVPAMLPFVGYDLWNAFEISWLNNKGKPIIGLATFIFPCESPNLIESKSFKLYLNSFNNTTFTSVDEVHHRMMADLSQAAGVKVTVELKFEKDVLDEKIGAFAASSIDEIDLVCDTYVVNSEFLRVGEKVVAEALSSDLLKSNCLVTGQPDWGSLYIQYKGKQIDRGGLLQYIVSFRNHHEFHEQCVERIYMDLMNRCRPTELMVYARYTRRGGLDINPLRASHPIAKVMNVRLFRQ